MADEFLRIESSQVKAVLREAPKFVNAGANRAFTQSGQDMGRELGRNQFGSRGVYTVRRKDRVHAPRKPRFKLNRKATLAGATGYLNDAHTLKGKSMKVEIRNPLLQQLQYGATIRPKKGDYLAVKLRNKSGKVRKTVRLKEIRYRAGTLGYFRSWDSLGVNRRIRMDKQMGSAIKRLERVKTRRTKKEVKRVVLRATSGRGIF